MPRTCNKLNDAVRHRYLATDHNHVPRVHVPMLSDPEGLDGTLDPEGLER